MKKYLRFAVALGALSPLAVRAQTAPVPVLQIDAGQVTARVSPTLYGLMTEEINYSYDGGLYAELIRNRVFKNNAHDPANWSAVEADGASATIALDETDPLNDILPVSLRLDVTSASADRRAGVANTGYWGIPVKPDTRYRASFYARATAGFDGPVTVSIESDDGATVYARAEVPRLNAGWRHYTVTLTTGRVAPTAKARFVLALNQPGTVWLNLVSLFPPTWHNRPNGNRIDLMQLLADMKPSFLRFPGGNYLEGDTIATRFDWKNTLGALTQRPGHAGPWGYRSSDGLGLLEFLEWCEDLKMQPLLAVYAGYSLHGEHVPAGPQLQPFVQDALDEIEYATGDTATTWGARRAQDGHPAPFPLTYVEIGNEDGFDKSGSYDGRFAQFYDAIKAKYPQLQIISTVGGKDGLGRRERVSLRRPDLVDEHYYRNAWEMEADANHYDHYDRHGPKIFVGEWATREGSPTTNLNAALGDAAWMTGMERNSDIVVMASYAPLFVNVSPGAMQWHSDLIGYDALTSYGSPSYYAQKMFHTYLGDAVLAVQTANIPAQTWQPRARRNGEIPAPRQVPTLFCVATRDTRAGTIFLKVVNTAATAQPVRIDVQGVTAVAPAGLSVVLTSANPTDTNSITEPDKVVPVASKIDGLSRSFTRTFAPHSINVLQIETQ